MFETNLRVKTAIIGGSFFLALTVLGGQVGTHIVSAVLAAVMCWEVGNVFFKLPDKKEKIITLVGFSWIFIFINAVFAKLLLETLVVSTVFLFTTFLVTAERHVDSLKTHFEEFVFTLFALLYIVGFLTFFPQIRGSLYGVHWLLIFLFIIWAGDTGAYFVGRKWGRKKLYPLISPKKTVEGAWGGLLCGVIIAVLYKLIFFTQLSFVGAVLTSVIIGVSSQVGDLCESFFKRAYGIKDSSQILPGHGGMLDRFDGVLFSLPLMYLCIKIFG